MSEKLNRRDFLVAGAGAGLAAAAPRALFGEAPAVIASPAARPVVISSANGNKFKNGGDVTCVQKAWAMIAQGSDVLDALIAGVNIVELDPEDDSVGYGGPPNADGVVQLDACSMHGPKRQAGGRAALQGLRTPAPGAKAGIAPTRPHPLVGQRRPDIA